MITARVVETGNEWEVLAVYLLRFFHPKTTTVLELDGFTICSRLAMTDMMRTLLAIHARSLQVSTKSMTNINLQCRSLRLMPAPHHYAAHISISLGVSRS